MKFLIVLSFFVSASALAVTAPLVSPKDPAKEFRCWKSMQNALNDAGVIDNWRPKMKPDLTFQYLRPTRQLSRWVVLEKIKNEEFLIRETPVQQMIIRYDQNCTPAVAVRPVKIYDIAGGFNDVRLAQTLSQNKAGIIYAWSPGMGLSFDGIKEVRKVAEKKKLPLTLVMDPYADEKVALKSLAAAGLSDVKIQKISSLELVNRNTLIHFPNFMMYRDGLIVGPMVPGLVGEKGYTHLVSKYLEQ